MTALHRAMPERPAARPAAVPAGGGADARVRHHGPGQPGARLALHDRRLFRRHLRGADRQLRARRGARRWSPRCRRHGGRSDRDAQALRPRPSRPRARHLRPDPVLQRAGAADLGPGGHEPAAAVLAQHLGSRFCRASIIRPTGSRSSSVALVVAVLALCPGDAHAPRHADPRRRLQPRNGRRARHQHPAALHAACSASAPRSPASPA